MAEKKPHIAILGAGPIGLEAALAAVDAGYPFTLYEADARIAANVRDWGHVRLFSPWKLDVSPRMRRHLTAAGLPVPEGDCCPTGRELVDHLLAPVAGLPAVASRLRLAARVVAVGRKGLLKDEEIGTPARAQHPFRLLVRAGHQRELAEEARVVLDCTGGYTYPNYLGDAGIPAPGELALSDAIRRRIPHVDAAIDQWAGRRILVVGAGHSAQTAVRDLARLAENHPGTQVLWALRSEQLPFRVSEDDPLPERARLTAAAVALASGASAAVEIRRGVVVEELARRNGHIAVTLAGGEGRCETIGVDRVLALTGSLGDHMLYRQLQVHECWATCGPMKLAGALLGASSGDCLTQTSHGPETLRNPEPHFFILGSKSYGRNSNFLMRLGWQQVEEVFGILAESLF